MKSHQVWVWAWQVSPKKDLLRPQAQRRKGQRRHLPLRGQCVVMTSDPSWVHLFSALAGLGETGSLGVKWAPSALRFSGSARAAPGCFRTYALELTEVPV